MATASKDSKPADDQATNEQDSKPTTKRYKVIVTRVNRIVNGNLEPVGYGKTIELDPNSDEARRLLNSRPPAIISLDDDGEDQPGARGNLDATPPGPPAGGVPAGSAGAPIGDDSPAVLS